MPPEDAPTHRPDSSPDHDTHAMPDPSLSDDKSPDASSSNNNSTGNGNDNDNDNGTGTGTGTGNSNNNDNNNNSNQDSIAKRPNAKDPSRPRRKKARRACYACQRAHLTCGDERPCLRCIKRGLQDHCHDGVRKKAKYLHDAPNEALVPGVGPNYPAPGSHAMSQTPDVSSMGQSSYYPTPVAPAGFAAFGHTPTSGSVTSPPAQNSPLVNPYASQQTIMAQPYPPPAAQQMAAPQDPALAQSSPDAKQPQAYNAPFFDPADPSLFNFDISSLNFGNHYGALEFGMLGHMSSGAVETPDADNSTLMTSVNQGDGIPFDPSQTQANPSNAYPGPFPYTNSTFNDWQRDTGARQSSTGQVFGASMPSDGASNGFDGQLSLPNAFAIGENNSIASASPSGNMMDFGGGGGAGYNSSPASSGTHLMQNQNQNHSQDFGRMQQHRPSVRSSFSANDIHQQRTTVLKRRRDPSEIYKSVTAPYSYTTGFHALTACVQKRYSPEKRVKIAKALAAIRPSFISCTKQLNVDDLVFMEKCFQRTLLEYDEFVTAYGTPALICRRTGEVAGVSKEFSLLTGWQRDVLLGKEANLNVNIGNASGTQTGTSSRGTSTPRIHSSGEGPGRPQSVLLPELMEEDDVIAFYEDFAKLAFGDSRGVCIKPCKLLKYKTKDDPGWAADAAGRSNGRAGSNKAAGSLISGESGMNSLGDRDGKVSCMYCWSVKRDVFDIPMMIVMNFLPII